MELKICGINAAAFAAAAEACGADYLGFIFVPGTPRAVTPAAVAAMARGLAGRAKKVGVFRDDAAAAIIPVARALQLAVIQLHRRATAEDVAALRAAGFEVWTLAGGAPGDGVLYDTSHGDGTPWPDVPAPSGAPKRILAGGIGEKTLAAACAHAPDILDVSSALESSPGMKPIARLQAFIAAWNLYRGTN